MTDLPELPFNKISLPKNDTIKTTNRNQRTNSDRFNQ